LTIAFAMVFIFGCASSFADDVKCPAAKSGSAACCARGEAKVTTVAQASETKQPVDPQAASEPKQDAHSIAATAPAAATAETPATSVQAPAAGETSAPTKVAEGSCPDVAGRNALLAFHENMHPMHVALEEGNYAEIRNLLPKLVESSKGVANYECAMGSKCPPECLKDFGAKKAGLLKAVDELTMACNSDDNAKVDATFGVMHEAYTQFASKCTHPEPAKLEKAKVEETK